MFTNEQKSFLDTVANTSTTFKLWVYNVSWQTWSSANSKGHCSDAASFLTASRRSVGTEALRATRDRCTTGQPVGEWYTEKTELKVGHFTTIKEGMRYINSEKIHLRPFLLHLIFYSCFALLYVIQRAEDSKQILKILTHCRTISDHEADFSKEISRVQIFHGGFCWL